MSSGESVADLLFGRELRVAVGAWIIRQTDDRFYQAQLVDALPDRVRSSIPQELARFVRAGMLVPEPQDAGQRRRYYRRTSSALWTIFGTANDLITELEAVAADGP